MNYNPLEVCIWSGILPMTIWNVWHFMRQLVWQMWKAAQNQKQKFVECTLCTLDHYQNILPRYYGSFKALKQVCCTIGHLEILVASRVGLVDHIFCLG